MLTFIFVGIMVALLLVVGFFALQARTNKRRGQAGSPSGGEGNGAQGRAPGLD